ncbi:hypothetical protein L202_04396 [Cryptococcus amylolentus CBS 6039]|uniref:Uncharacterized protein n=1 Tax=Cryptococcus amylolentus CBS 6039 TaxID=1295533 RepID=A0A1E3HRU3_9TREE|nr:hypothetical protein L202_04396 [Cryptococcus amylolentus CBS 6039]ODN78855.1 hypothetical protein L202_04396 [Cryptococcus amylolentus CBS 6039]
MTAHPDRPSVSDGYYGMVPIHRPLVVNVHGTVESEPVNREFVVGGRLIIKRNLTLPFRWAFRLPTHAQWEKIPLPRKGQELDLVGKFVDRREGGVFVLEPFSVVFTARAAPQVIAPSSAESSSSPRISLQRTCRTLRRRSITTPRGAQMGELGWTL